MFVFLFFCLFVQVIKRHKYQILTAMTHNSELSCVNRDLLVYNFLVFGEMAPGILEHCPSLITVSVSTLYIVELLIDLESQYKIDHCLSLYLNISHIVQRTFLDFFNSVI